MDQRDPGAQEADPPVDDGPELQGPSDRPGETAHGPLGATGSSPSHHAVPESVTAPGRPASQPGIETLQHVKAIDELTVADSFIVGVLRGWRLLQAAGLTAEEKRDILSTTRNSLDYEVVSQALQGLWDDQLLGQRYSGGGSSGNYLTAIDTFAAYHPEDEWSYGENPWWDDFYGYTAEYDDSDWWFDNEDYNIQAATNEALPEEDEALREAQAAEKAAEGLALEAQRTWSDAQKATQAQRQRIWSCLHGWQHHSLLQLRRQPHGS